VSEVWLSTEEVCRLTGEIKETVRRKCKCGKYVSTFTMECRNKIYSILLSSLPQKAQDKYFAPKEEHNIEKITANLESYANAPDWAKKQADKYLELISLTKDMTHSEIEAFLNEWNKQHPEKSSSYTRLYLAKREYEKFGISALLSKKQLSGRKRHIPEEYFKYYKDLYLNEGKPSAFSCWLITLGYAKCQEIINETTFPSWRTFDRQLKKAVPEQGIYLARYGNSAWYKKYASYIPRDYTNLLAGSCWVSDHAQIDVAVNFNGSVCFPWVTVFRDIKTSKWLGWFLHADSPNSDHIFQAFYYGVQKFGLPNDIYLDNGKDYRCKDFAGGRNNKVKVNHTQDKENSLMRNIGVDVHFALPYNAQTKPVERDFLKVKTYLSKHFIGYRGGKITERPEKLKDEIKNDKIMQFDEFKTLFDDFIENTLNKMPSKGKVLQGRCPDELWAEEFTNKKVIGKDALKLFCMRTSRPVSIGRNGVYDSQLKLTYWDEWMICEKGRKVFIRRDINAYQEAWVFDAVTEEYLGKGNVNQAVSFLAKTNIEKAQYKKAIEQKNKEKKILKSYIKSTFNPSNAELAVNLQNGLSKKEFICNPKISEISNTKMDQVVNIEKNSNRKPPKYVTPLKGKQKLFLTESEKRRALAKEAM
jgi:putative transposase